MPSNRLILCHPLLLLPSIFPSIRVFFNESALRIRWPKDWSFTFSISLSNEYSRFISFGIDWFDLLAVQGILKSLCQHHSSKVSILPYSAFFMVQISHPYMTIGKAIALTIWTFVGKVMSLLFNVLSKFVIAFLPRSKGFLISWLQSPSAVILERPPTKKENLSLFPLFPLYLPWSDGAGCHYLFFFNIEFQTSFFTLLFHPYQEFFSSFILSAIRVVSSVYLGLLTFLMAILIPACYSSSLAFCTMYSACEINKQDDNIVTLQSILEC